MKGKLRGFHQRPCNDQDADASGARLTDRTVDPGRGREKFLKFPGAKTLPSEYQSTC